MEVCRSRLPCKNTLPICSSASSCLPTRDVPSPPPRNGEESKFINIFDIWINSRRKLVERFCGKHPSLTWQSRHVPCLWPSTLGRHTHTVQKPGCGYPDIDCCPPSGTFSILIAYHPSLALTPLCSHFQQMPASDPESAKDKDVPKQAWFGFSSCSKDSKWPFSVIQSSSTHL